jgi:hypothetical protein
VAGRREALLAAAVDVHGREGAMSKPADVAWKARAAQQRQRR